MTGLQLANAELGREYSVSHHRKMQEYDVALKLLLQASTDSILRQLTGVTVDRWMNVELPQVQATRVDLLGSTAEGHLVHIELQSNNDLKMPLRMAEYLLRVYRQFGKFPRQILLYVGEPELRMESALIGPSLSFQYSIVDVKTIDGSQLLASPRFEDNVVAILTRIQDKESAVRQILSRIATLEAGAREAAFASLLIISGLRKLEQAVKKEAQTMPILNNILDHEVIGPAIRQGLQQGLEQGLEQGLQQGIQQGSLSVLQRQIQKRFGTLPEWAESRLASLSITELDDLSVRILDAKSLEDLFPG